MCEFFQLVGHIYVFLAWIVYLSWVNVNVIICMERLGVSLKRYVYYVVVPCMYMMFGHGLARHAHFEVLRVQQKIHGRMVSP